MNQISMRKKSPFDYKAVIFDLDGTLYYQKPFRLCMIRFLVGHALTHPLAIKDFLIIKKYRTVREQWERYEKECGRQRSYQKLGLEDKQYQYVADRMKVKREDVKKVIHFYMQEAPLRFLPAYKDGFLSDLITTLHKKKITVAVYSDYPVEDKLKALGIKADVCYTSADASINCMKPDPKGIAVILEDIGCSAKDVLMIGDRYEKDGLAAQGNDVDFVIVSKKEKERRQLSWS